MSARDGSIKSHHLICYQSLKTRLLDVDVPAACWFQTINSSSSLLFASCAIDSKRCGNRIGVTADSGREADTGDVAASGNIAVITHVLYRHVCSALRITAIPQ